MSAANYYSMLIFFTTIWRRLHCYTSSTTTEDINSMHWLLKGSDIIRPNLGPAGPCGPISFFGPAQLGQKWPRWPRDGPRALSVNTSRYSDTPLRTGVLREGCWCHAPESSTCSWDTYLHLFLWCSTLAIYLLVSFYTRMRIRDCNSVNRRVTFFRGWWFSATQNFLGGNTPVRPRYGTLKLNA